MKLYNKKTIIYRDEQPYLIRYSIITCKWFSVKLHNILLSDYACLHDHPWTFISILLKGWYVEHQANCVKLYGPGSILYRPAKFAHRLEIKKQVWSLVITFKKVRQWGFFTKTGWVYWKQYSDTGSCEGL